MNVIFREPSNRTNLESKPSKDFLTPSQKVLVLLIAPIWNRNKYMIVL